jgi:hypothetical protein
MQKYDKEAPFADPVVRCDSCGKLMRTEELHKNGICQCGNRKVRAILSFNWREKMLMKYWWRIDPEYLALFSRGEA